MWIYVCNLKKYNEGELDGEIINLPVETSVLEQVIAKYSNNNNNDIAIHDYELPFEISEYESLIKINEVCKFIKDSEIDPCIITHIEDDKGEKIVDLDLQDLQAYYFEVIPVDAETKKEFCLKYYNSLGFDLSQTPDEMRNATDWEHVFEQLEIKLVITRNKDSNKFYYTVRN